MFVSKAKTPQELLSDLQRMAETQLKSAETEYEYLKRTRETSPSKVGKKQIDQQAAKVGAVALNLDFLKNLTIEDETEASPVTIDGQIRGRDLVIGSIVKTWFNGTSVVMNHRPYDGPLAYLWPEGVRIVEFTSNTRRGRTEMTVGNDDTFEVTAFP